MIDSHSVTMLASRRKELTELISLVRALSRILADADHHQAVEHLHRVVAVLDRHGRQ